MKLISSLVCKIALIALFFLSASGCDQVSDVASGAGSATKNLADTVTGGESEKDQDEDGSEGNQAGEDDPSEEDESSQTASGVIGGSETGSDGNSTEENASDDKFDDESEAVDERPRGNDFRLVFEQSYQSCDSCGIWFDSAELVIEHSEGRFSAGQTGSLLIKEAPYHQGRFNADISSIPQSAEIQSAILYMHLNRHEGISNDDFTSTLSAFGYIDGSMTPLREITAEHDIKGKGYSKANPVVPIDFTDFARRI